MIVTYSPSKDDKLSTAQVEAIERAEKFPPVFDEDSPALTPAMEKGLLVSAAKRNMPLKTKQK